MEIPETLFRRVKQYCCEHGVSFRKLIETGLRSALDPPKPKTPFRLKPFGFQGEGLNLQDWSMIRELIYEGWGGVAPDESGR